MATNAIFTVKYRRKREGRTHYKKRLELLKSGQTRLVIRRSNTAVTVQFVNYEPDGDKVLLTYNSTKLESVGWKYSKKSVSASYLAGLAAGKEALAKGVKNAILDMGLQSPISGSKIYAVLKGIVDAGVDVPHSSAVFPSDSRIKGEHIAKMGDISKQATKYQKESLKVEDLPKVFETVKAKLQG